jgi:hypothetical protein
MTRTHHTPSQDEHHTRHEPLEAVVAVFSDSDQAEAAVRELGPLGLEFDAVPQHIPDHPAPHEERAAVLQHLSEVFFEPSREIKSSDVAGGASKGAAIGALAGALLVALPGIGLGVVVGGALGGAFIGGIAAIDEVDRAIHLPTLADYRAMLRAGKSLVVVYAQEAKRVEIENQLKLAGADQTYQHPPVLHAIRKTDTPASETP